MSDQEVQIKHDEDFMHIVKAAGAKGLVVVNFFASWCTPCQRIVPKLETMQKEFADHRVAFFKVDVDENTDPATMFHVTAVPTYVLFQDAVEVDRFQGANVAAVKEMVEKHLAEQEIIDDAEKSHTTIDL